jgi:hypothetical protein
VNAFVLSGLLSTIIHGLRPLPTGWRRCKLRRWTRAKARIHLAGSHLSEPLEGRSVSSGLLLFHRAIRTVEIVQHTDSDD